MLHLPPAISPSLPPLPRSPSLLSLPPSPSPSLSPFHLPSQTITSVIPEEDLITVTSSALEHGFADELPLPTVCMVHECMCSPCMYLWIHGCMGACVFAYIGAWIDMRLFSMYPPHRDLHTGEQLAPPLTTPLEL